MKKTLVLALFLIIGHFLASTILADASLTVFLLPYPSYTSKEMTTMANKITKPGKIAQNSFKYACNPVTVGVIATFGGFLGISDIDGQMLFPLKTSLEKLQVVIAPRITPLIMLGSTISHWEVDPGVAYKNYVFERKTDEQTDSTFWDVREGNSLDKRKVPLESLIIFAKPEHIYIPTGITLTQKSPNLVLPEIYVKHHTDITSSSLQALFFLHYFGPVSPLIKPLPTGYIQDVVY